MSVWSFEDASPRQMGPWAYDGLLKLAGPWPVRWLFKRQEHEPERVVNLFAGIGGWEYGAQDILGLDLDIAGIEQHKDTAATAVANGLHRIVCDVTALDPRHPALHEVTGLIVSAPCQCWTPAGLRKGRDNLSGLQDMFTCAWEAIAGYPHEDVCEEVCGEECTSLDAWSGPAYDLAEVRAMGKAMTDPRAALIAEVSIWALGLSAAFWKLKWVVMEQSSALPEDVLEWIKEDLYEMGWFGAAYKILDAVDLGLASRRKRVFLVGMRDSMVNLEGLEPKRPVRQTKAREALGWAEGRVVNTRGVGRTSGGNGWSADKPATGITSKIRGWYPEDDPDYRFTNDEAAVLVGIQRGKTYVGKRTPVHQGIGDVVSPFHSAQVLGYVHRVDWEEDLHAYRIEIYPYVKEKSRHGLAA